MSADKYPNIFSRQMKAIVYITAITLDLSVEFNISNGGILIQKFQILFL